MNYSLHVTTSTLPVAGGWRIALAQVDVPAADAVSAKAPETTIIFAHATGMHKEIFYPTMRYLLQKVGDSMGRMRLIALDARNHGESAALNAKLLDDEGYTFSWWHAADDIQAIISHHVRPGGKLVGIGHSFGGCALTMAALQGARFDALGLFEPTIASCFEDLSVPLFKKKTGVRWDTIRAVAARKGSFTSRDEARANFESKPFFKSWDSECFDLYIQHGLRNSLDGDGVVLACSPKLEAENFKLHEAESPVVHERLLKQRLPNVDVIVCAGSLSNHFTRPSYAMANRRVVVRDPYLANEVFAKGEFVTIDGASHMVVCEKPEAVAALIHRLLERNRSLSESCAKLDVDML